jgi:hypothetical protein
MKTEEIARSFAEFATEKVSGGADSQEKKELFDLAIVAWNIAYWDDKEKRDQFVRQVREQYVNSGYGNEKVAQIVSKLHEYIDEKRERILFPKNQILGGEIQELPDGKVAFRLDISEHEGK